MTEFQFDGDATIKHLNVRKEGPEDDKALAIDIKFEGKTDATLCDYFDPLLRDFLFTDGVIARPQMMEAVGFVNQIENCELTLLEQTFFGVKLHKFKVRPVDGGLIELTFAASFKPSKNEVAVIAEYVCEAVHVTCRPQPGLDFDGEGQ